MITEPPLDLTAAHERASATLTAARGAQFIDGPARPPRTVPLVAVAYAIAIVSLAVALALPFWI
ncbi:hypothetical protein [Pararhodobacter zhoushanensis]|uniref:Uncharacterized protein n=1 Tax=Pararhodobacter zhoushanensis TaxID=2479545 RepID=A0ABT3GYK8_9RHOB|nr:hypothetical protein [Pararhodobacter zhoushanensis]MCW1932645.1 hypothetical protein [Pararhodobacter zhoushanensis]